jgi:hypothetical protein
MGGFSNPEIAKKAGAKSKPGKHERTKQWEALHEKIVGECTDKVMDYLDSLPPAEMFKAYLNLLEYFKPKLQRSDVDITSNGKELAAPTFNFKPLDE